MTDQYEETVRLVRDLDAQRGKNFLKLKRYRDPATGRFAKMPNDLSPHDYLMQWFMQERVNPDRKTQYGSYSGQLQMFEFKDFDTVGNEEHRQNCSICTMADIKGALIVV